MPPKSDERSAKSPSPALVPKSPKASPQLKSSASPAVRPANVRAVVSLPNEIVGVVIGKEGRTLHRIERMFSVTMKVTKEGAAQGHELCIVEGAEAGSVAMCESYIHGLSHPDCELILPEEGVVIPKRLSGRLIGSRGSNKEMFEKNSGAVIEFDQVNTRVHIKGTQKAVAAAAILVRKFISNELVPKRKLGQEEQALVLEADKAGIHLNANQLDTFSKCVKETYTLALKSFAAEDAQFLVLMKKQGIRWTWRVCDVECAEFEEVPPALAAELERLHADRSDAAVIFLPDTSSYDVNMLKMSVRSLADDSQHQLQRSCAAPALHAPRTASSPQLPASTSLEADTKAAILSHRLMQFGFQHREVTICLRNGCACEMDALVCALADLQSCTWLSNMAAQDARKSASAAPSSGGLVPMFVRPQQDQHQKVQHAQAPLASRRPVLLDGCNIALRHGYAKSFSCRGILAALNWFHGKGHEVYVIVPQSRLDIEPSLQQPPCVDHHILIQLREQGRVVPVPGCRVLRADAHVLNAPCDDRFILELASRSAAVVVSNDSFNDLVPGKPEWQVVAENRLISFTFAGDVFVPVEDMQPLESLLLHDMQPVSFASAHGSGASISSPPISPLMAAARIGSSSVPSEWICPLSNKIMVDPVTASDGVNYERRALCDWMKESNVSPATGSRLTSKSFVENEALKEEIRIFVNRKGTSVPAAVPPYKL